MAAFTIESSEGLPIRGDLEVPRGVTPRALAVIVHGFKGFKDWGFFPWLADGLCQSGVVTCRFNMSRSGIGERPEIFDRLDLFAGDTYSKQVADLRAVAAYAHSKHPKLPVFLVGHSRGGGIALLSGGGVPGLAGIVTWSAISYVNRWDEPTVTKWRAEGKLDVVNSRTGQIMPLSTAILNDCRRHKERLDILRATDALKVPLLVIHGASDESVPSSEGEAIAARGTDTSLVMIGSATHTYNAAHPLVSIPPALELAAKLTTHFVHAYV